MTGQHGRRVTERRNRLRLATVLCTACTASAAPAPDPLAALIACRELLQDTARLACFDRELKVLVNAALAPKLAPEQAFGLPPMAVAAKESAAAGRTELAEFRARLVGLGRPLDGRVVLTLDNGQVWRQVTQGEELLLKTGDIVTLSRGALHSYWLDAPSGRRCKVTRIR
jgi:hypothetical protein